MDSLQMFVSRLKALFLQQAQEEELDQELQAHLDLLTDKYQQQGMGLADARAAARRQFGRTISLKESLREQRTFLAVDNLLLDIRYALRQMWKSPGFSVTALLTIALGFGANTAIFSFVNGTLLRSLEYPRASEIVNIWEKPPGSQRGNRTSALTFLDWRKQNNLFSMMAAEIEGPLPLSGEGEPAVLRSARVSAQYFKIFGVNAALGRTFTSDEDSAGRDQVAIVSNRLWRGRFGGNANIIGQKLMLGGKPFTLIGVMPADSRFDRDWADVWIPLAFATTELNRDFHWLRVWARLQSGVTLERCRQQMTILAQRLATTYPTSNQDWGVIVDRYADVAIDKQLRTSLYMLLGATGVLLLISGANLANLIAVRGTDRQQELAVRRALGADSWRIVRQLVNESLLISVFGGGIGIAFGLAIMHAVKRLLPPNYLPADASVALDLPTLFVAAAVIVAIGIISSLSPAFRANKIDPRSALQQQSRSATQGTHGSRFKRVLIVGEVALSFVLLTAAGLLVRSFYELQHAATGFDSDQTISAWLPVTGPAKANLSEISNYYQQVIDAVGAIPGVRSAALTSALPVDGETLGAPFQITGRAAVPLAKRPVAYLKIITPGYFQTLHMQLIAGRELTRDDTYNSRRVVVINQSLAKRYFQNDDPIGKHIFFQDVDLLTNHLGKDLAWEVVGVVANEKIVDLSNFWTCLYVSNSQLPTPVLALLLRATGDPNGVIRSAQKVVWKINKNQPFDRIRTLEAIKLQSIGPERLRTVLLVVFSLLAIGLATIGIYGVIGWSVAQRTQEFGLRSALGASQMDVLCLILRDTFKLASLGLAIGVVCAFVLTRLLSSLLFQVQVRDPLSYGVAALVVFCGAIVAGLIPAVRAASLSPIIALRNN
jgi:putative ABC transport system permease protein